MINTVFTKTFDAPTIDKNEILRYAGVKELTRDLEAILDECICEIEDKLTYKVCYAQFPLHICDAEVDLSFTKVHTDKLKKNLSDCHSFILFAATIGIEIDRLISKYGRISPSKALILQAIGAERIESLCNTFNDFVSDEYGHTAPRFSPGYGDFPLEVQKDFFRVLEPNRKIGISLNDSMLMSPSKSVTAIIGISGKEQVLKKHSCSQCNKTDCSFRRKP